MATDGKDIPSTSVTELDGEVWERGWWRFDAVESRGGCLRWRIDGYRRENFTRRGDPVLLDRDRRAIGAITSIGVFRNRHSGSQGALFLIHSLTEALSSALGQLDQRTKHVTDWDGVRGGLWGRC